MSPVPPGDAAPGRVAAHAALCAALASWLTGRGDWIATGVATLSGKRPDLVSLSREGALVVWEVKTRFSRREREQAWTKYSSSADLLVLVYPPAVDLSRWLTRSWHLVTPAERCCGAGKIASTGFELLHPPFPLTPRPAAVAHLTLSVLRRNGLPAPITSAAESNSP